MPLNQNIMPKTGAEMESGKIISWKKQPGEPVKTGEILLEIETDKATMEVESPASGVLLRQLFGEGENVPATQMMAVVGDGSESAEEVDRFVRGGVQAGEAPAPSAPSLVAPPASAPVPQAEPRGADQRVKASPLARRLAQEKGIKSGEMVKITSARGSIQGKAMVTKRIKPMQVAGKTVHQIGFPIHWGFLGRGEQKGQMANIMTPTIVDPNSFAPEYKGFLVKLEKV